MAKAPKPDKNGLIPRLVRFAIPHAEKMRECAEQKNMTMVQFYEESTKSLLRAYKTSNKTPMIVPTPRGAFRIHTVRLVPEVFQELDLLGEEYGIQTSRLAATACIIYAEKYFDRHNKRLQRAQENPIASQR